MKNVTLSIIFIGFFYQICFAQTLKATYDPSFKTETGSGFYSNFEFTSTPGNSQNKATVIVLTAVKVNLDKGWYEKQYSAKAKIYTCSQLKGLCETTELGGFWIRITWEYAGKVYQNGGQFTGKKIGDKYTFLNVKNYFTPPSDIPVDAWLSTTVKEISISSCSYTTSNDIFKIVNNIK